MLSWLSAKHSPAVHCYAALSHTWLFSPLLLFFLFSLHSTSLSCLSLSFPVICLPPSSLLSLPLPVRHYFSVLSRFSTLSSHSRSFSFPLSFSLSLSVSVTLSSPISTSVQQHWFLRKPCSQEAMGVGPNRLPRFLL